MNIHFLVQLQYEQNSGLISFQLYSIHFPLLMFFEAHAIYLTTSSKSLLGFVVHYV